MSASPSLEPVGEKVTVRTLRRMKDENRLIVCLTAYEALTARLLDESGVDVILVGDSAGMVMAGRKDTLGVTLDEMLHFTRWAAQGVERAMLVADMPFLSYQVNADEAVRNAGRLMAEGGAEAVKLEGGRPIAPTIQRLVSAGMPVMGHLGLTPQSINAFGGYVLQGVEEEEQKRIIEDAAILEDAGCFSIVLEKIPASVAEKVTAAVNIPTIGIGAGTGCDGQILVTQDMLGLFTDFRPKFVRRYAEIADDIVSAVSKYVDDVRSGSFPGPDESYDLDEG